MRGRGHGSRKGRGVRGRRSQERGRNISEEPVPQPQGLREKASKGRCHDMCTNQTHVARGTKGSRSRARGRGRGTSQKQIKQVSRGRGTQGKTTQRQVTGSETSQRKKATQRKRQGTKKRFSVEDITRITSLQQQRLQAMQVSIHLLHRHVYSLL